MRPGWRGPLMTSDEHSDPGEGPGEPLPAEPSVSDPVTRPTSAAARRRRPGRRTMLRQAALAATAGWVETDGPERAGIDPALDRHAIRAIVRAEHGDPFAVL